MAFHLLSVCQSDGPGPKTLAVVILAPVVLVFAILMFLGSGLFDSPHVFIFVIAVGMPSNNILFDGSHGLQTGAVWSVLLSRDDNWVNVIWIWVPDLSQQRTDLHFFWDSFPAFPSHNGMCIVE